MADDLKNNTTRRARVEDANYVLSAEEPNRPRVREEPASLTLPLVSMLFVCAALLVLTAMMLPSLRAPAGDRPTEILFAAERSLPGESVTQLEDISASVAAYYRSKGRDVVPGVEVFSVASDGSGAGLRPGDVVTALNGENVSADELALALQDAPEALTLTVYRDGAYLELCPAP